jgi:hypothetical protein
LPKEAWPLVDLASTLAVDSGIGLHSRNSAPQVVLAKSASEKLQGHRHKSQRSGNLTLPTVPQYAISVPAQQEEQPVIIMNGELSAPEAFLLWL